MFSMQLIEWKAWFKNLLSSSKSSTVTVANPFGLSITNQSHDRSILIWENQFQHNIPNWVSLTKLIKTNVHRLDFGEANHGTEDMVIASISARNPRWEFWKMFLSCLGSFSTGVCWFCSTNLNSRPASSEWFSFLNRIKHESSKSKRPLPPTEKPNIRSNDLSLFFDIQVSEFHPTTLFLLKIRL